MGIPTLVLPDETEWNLLAPEWAVELYSELMEEAELWCKKKKVSLDIDDCAFIEFDNIEYKALSNCGKAIWFGFSDYVAKTVDNRHTITLCLDKTRSSFDKTYHEMVIDGHKIEGFLIDSRLAVNSANEYLCFNWENETKTTVVYNLNARKLQQLPDFIHNFYIEGGYIRGFNDAKESCRIKIEL